MSIQILDCTLRDGGYVNNWHFNYNVIQNIIKGLVFANIDIIEVGFLEDCKYSIHKTKFNDVEQISEFVKTKNKEFVAMTRCNKLNYKYLKKYDGKSIDSIRLAFHKNEIEQAKKESYIIKEKGYKLYMQPVGISEYTEDEIIDLIKITNIIKPYSFYIVDTNGVMDKYNISLYLKLINENLNEDIKIGLHSHNNLQLSFSNAIEFVELSKNKHIIIDSSLYGIGRGAGNLCTELITQRISSDCYNIDVIVDLIDKYILPIKKEYDWGYLLQYYLTAINRCHPDYAKFLGKNKLNNQLKKIPLGKRGFFSKKILEDF